MAGFKNAAMKGGANGVNRPEGSNASMSGKTKVNGVASAGSQYGTTYCNEPMSFKNTGAGQKGKIASNGVVQHAEGPTRTTNKSHISFPNANKSPASSKTVSKNEPRLSTSGMKTVGDKSASQTSGAGDPTTRAYALNRGYSKSGKGDKRSQSIY